MNAKKMFLGLLDTVVKVVFIIFVAMLIVKYAKVAYDYGYHIFNQTAVSSGTGRTVSVTIKDGEGTITYTASEAGDETVTLSSGDAFSFEVSADVSTLIYVDGSV